jgi:RNA polymerase sigma factor (sigma-70 family)
MNPIPVDWNEGIRLHNDRVVAFLLRRGVSADRAEELAQESWARLIEQNRRGRFERIELPGLVLAQARFLALDEVRRAAFIATKPPTDSTTPDPADPEARLENRDRLARARQALDECSPRAQRVFRHLCAHPAETHADAAEKLGLSEQRVRQVMCEVRKRLRQAVN